MDKLDTVQIGSLVVTTSFTPPPNSVGDAQFTSADPLTIDKQRHKGFVNYAQDKGSAAASVTARVVWVADSSGVVTDVKVGSSQANVGGATIAVDVKKNGSTILSAPVTLTNSHTAYQKVAGAIATADYVAGDVFEVSVTATVGGGTLGQGLFTNILFDETP